MFDQEDHLSKTQRTAVSISKIKTAILQLEESLKNCNKTTKHLKKVVLMLPKTYYSIAKDKEGEYFTNNSFEPQLFSLKKARALKFSIDSEEGDLQIVSKFEFLQHRLEAAKGLLALFEKAVKKDSNVGNYED